VRSTVFRKLFQCNLVSYNRVVIAGGEIEAALGSAVTAGALANKAIDQSIALSKLSTASYSDFNSNGMRITSDVMKTPQAQTLIKEIQAGNLGIPASDTVDIAAAYIKSGTTLPQQGVATSGSMLIKIVPKGDAVSATTGYWMNIQQARALATMTPEQVGQMLGLPATQTANILKNGVDFYVITPKPGITPTVFVSDIASTTQGVVNMPGTAQQVIVPNRSQWTAPSLVNPFSLRTKEGR